MSICQLGYGIGVFAPGKEEGTAGQYKCGHNLLLAHGKAVQLYRGKYQKQQQGRISISISGHWGRPASENSDAGGGGRLRVLAKLTDQPIRHDLGTLTSVKGARVC